ncbi:MAG: (Fe-S)-binding protein [Acidimicrobiia bacterium]|nr:(Fe-S)-binding protein [Acidimicrobiia bacterium]
MTWRTEHPPTTEDLNSCIDCGLCLSACPTYSITGDETASPRGRIAAMRAVDRGTVALDNRFAQIVDSCLQCLACETVCPSLVPFGTLMEGARAEVAAHRPTPTTAAKRFIFGRLIASRRALMFLSWLLVIAQRLGITGVLPGRASKAKAIRTIPIPVSATAGRQWDPQGEPIGTVGFLSGCVMDHWYSEVHVAVIDLLTRAGYRVVAPKQQTCCGAIAAHEGAAQHARRMAQRNVEAFAGFDTIIVDSAGCSAHMKDYAHWTEDGADLAGRIADANQVIAKLIADGKLPTITERRGQIAIQDPCHLRHAQGITLQPRDILRAAGYEVVETDPTGTCCGAAGAYQLSHPQVSERLGRRKAAQVAATDLDRVASANPGCEMQLLSYLGNSTTVEHPIEIYRNELNRNQEST